MPHRVVGSWVARIFHPATARRQGRSYPRFRVWVRPLRLPWLPFALAFVAAAAPASAAAQARPDTARARADSARTRADSARSPSDSGRVTDLFGQKTDLGFQFNGRFESKLEKTQNERCNTEPVLQRRRAVQCVVPAGLRLPVRRQDRGHVRRPRARQRRLQLHARIRRVQQHFALLRRQEGRLAPARGRRQRHVRRAGLAIHHDGNSRRATTASRRSHRSASSRSARLPRNRRATSSPTRCSRSAADRRRSRR